MKNSLNQDFENLQKSRVVEFFPEYLYNHWDKKEVDQLLEEKIKEDIIHKSFFINCPDCSHEIISRAKEINENQISSILNCDRCGYELEVLDKDDVNFIKKPYWI